MFSKSSPKVTIMIPTYNQANLVSNAILSALNQDYDNLEIIISDDNSNDNTASIVAPFLKDNRVKYYKNYSNLGSIKNYQKTLYEYATGEWIVNLDGDDFLTNRSFISKAIQVVISDDSVGFVFSNYAIYDENDGSTIKIKNK
jgi:glycosyltransferase involved in cell wall biosynthesis